MWRIALAGGLVLGGCTQLIGIDHFAVSIDADDGHIDAPPADGPRPVDARTDARIDAMPTIDAAPDASVPDGGGGGTMLTVKNYLSWCSVSVNGGASSTAATQTTTVTAGTAVPLAAAPAGGFKLGSAPWHHTDGDTGSGELGTVTAGVSHVTATVNASGKCVWICCPFTDGSGCPTTDQCP